MYNVRCVKPTKTFHCSCMFAKIIEKKAIKWYHGYSQQGHIDHRQAQSQTSTLYQTHRASPVDINKSISSTDFIFAATRQIPNNMLVLHVCLFFNQTRLCKWLGKFISYCSRVWSAFKIPSDRNPLNWVCGTCFFFLEKFANRFNWKLHQPSLLPWCNLWTSL